MPRRRNQQSQQQETTQLSPSSSSRDATNAASSTVNIDGIIVPASDPNINALRVRSEKRKRKRQQRLDEVDKLKDAVRFFHEFVFCSQTDLCLCDRAMRYSELARLCKRQSSTKRLSNSTELLLRSQTIWLLVI